MATVLETAPMGHNAPPPVETWKLHIEDLMAEAQNWLDGAPILTQAQADDVGKLLGQLREARKGADAQRAAEKKPHDDAAKAVQAVWKPLLDRVETAEQVAKKALAPFLAAEEAKKRAAAEDARKEAERKAEEARAAIRAAQETDLGAREQAEALVKEAEQAAKAASKAEKDKPMAAGMGRSVSLRSVWHAELTDPVLALKYYKMTQPEELKAWLQSQADKDVRNGTRSIPGFDVKEERVAQ